MNIVFTIKDEDINILVNCIKSIIKNKGEDDEFSFFVLGKLSKKSKEKLLLIHYINFVETDKGLFGISELELDKVLFLYANGGAQTSLKTLWETDLGENVIGAVKSTKYKGLYNIGMLLIDLVKWNEYSGEIIKYQSEYNGESDLQVINNIFDGKIMELESKWNIQNLLHLTHKETSFFQFGNITLDFQKLGISDKYV